MQLFFISKSLSDLAEADDRILQATKCKLLSRKGVVEVNSPAVADAIIIQEKNSFKNFRYIKELLGDPIVSKYPHKVFTINNDDWATGLLKGIYTSLPSNRFHENYFRAIPYMKFPNEYVFQEYQPKTSTSYLASWRGNIISNKIRSTLLDLYQNHHQFCLESTESWLNHDSNEKREYVNLIRNSNFSLCPAGWAPISFRIYESMALGTCPVIIADQFVPPKGPNWNEFALFFPEANLKNLLAFLNKNKGRAGELGLNASTAWRNHFGKARISEYYADSLISLIKSVPDLSRKDELKRWTSFKFQWSNHWTLPQRAAQKLKKVKSLF